MKDQDNLKDEVINDPILLKMNEFVGKIKEEIQDMGQKKLKDIEIFYKRYQNDAEY